MPQGVDNFDKKAQAVACGIHHTLILTTEGQIFSFGSNIEGQLGAETQHSSSITPVLVDDISHIPMTHIAAGSFSASVAKDTGSLYLWGTGSFGEFRTPHRVKKIKEKVIELSIGHHFGMVLTEERNLYTWGDNSMGQLGSGDFIDRPTPQLM